MSFTQSTQEVSSRFDVVIVGAGAAGIGMALELIDLPFLRLCILESGRTGESFRCWPVQTHFITPSFDAGAFGLPDLNAVDQRSSPADSSGVEHLDGTRYATYLETLVAQHELPVHLDTRVLEVLPFHNDDFVLKTSRGEFRARAVIWATGEFQFPELQPFPGAELGHHYARITDWRRLSGHEQVVIGGNESAIDAAINLVELGHHVHLLTPGAPRPLPESRDPSQTLSPHTRARFQAIADSERLKVSDAVEVTSLERVTPVEPHQVPCYRVTARDGRTWHSPVPAILGTGFIKGGGASTIAGLWEWEDGEPELSDHDESTCTPGLFLVGPRVSHDAQNYCFIYKFRQRFPRVRTRLIEYLGDAARGAGHDTWTPAP